MKNKKKYFFYFVRSDLVQCIFSFEPDRSGQNSGACSTVHGRIPMNSGGILHCSLKKTHGSTVHRFSQHKKQQRATSYKPVAVPQLIVGLTNINLLLEHYQTVELLWLLQTQKQHATKHTLSICFCPNG